MFTHPCLLEYVWCRFKREICCDVGVLGVRVSPEMEKVEDIVKGILKHGRSSHRPGIHQRIYANESIVCRLFYTLSRLKGATEDS